MIPVPGTDLKIVETAVQAVWIALKVQETALPAPETGQPNTV